ncbi:MAG: hypothetical protein IPP40_12635 [bacterium]|nr:hypothetical protein [bacterium]
MAQDRFNVSLLDRYTAATIRTVRVESGIAYVMRELNGLDILDVSNPIDIQLLRHMALAGFTNDAVVSGDRLYLTSVTTASRSMIEPIRIVLSC